MINFLPCSYFKNNWFNIFGILKIGLGSHKLVIDYSYAIPKLTSLQY